MRPYLTRWRRPLLLAIVLATALFFAPSMIASAVPRAQPVQPATVQPLEELTGDQFDQAFLVQMSMHHAMGVMMTRPVIAAGGRPELKSLGAQMIADQSREIEQMRGWLQSWYGLDVSCPMMQAMLPTEPMTGRMTTGLIAPRSVTPGWMLDPSAERPAAGPMRPGGPMGMMPGMPMMGMPMMGMPMMGVPPSLSPDQLDAAFMISMIAHHQGAIDMAVLAEERAAHPDLKRLARSIIASQSAEIETMQGWLEDRPRTGHDERGRQRSRLATA